MTTNEIILMTCLYLAALVAAIYFTRATVKRVAGAVAAGFVVGAMGMGIIALCEALGLWRIPFVFFAGLFYLGLSISLAPIYLITWRVARRFGLRGLLVCVGIVAIIGPPRDYMYATKFPRWMVFAPGVAPIIADSVTYILIVVVGHAVMRLVAGPSDKDGLVNRAQTTA